MTPSFHTYFSKTQPLCKSKQDVFHNNSSQILITKLQYPTMRIFWKRRFLPELYAIAKLILQDWYSTSNLYAIGAGRKKKAYYIYWCITLGQLGYQTNDLFEPNKYRHTNCLPKAPCYTAPVVWLFRNQKLSLTCKSYTQTNATL